MKFVTARKAIVRVGLAVGLATSAMLPALAQDDAVVATIDGVAITESDLQLAEGELGQRFQQLPPEQRRAAALSAVIEIRMLANKAKAAGYGDDPQFKKQLAFIEQRALHSALLEKDLVPQVTDEAVRALYDKQMAEAKPVNEVKARHILVATKEEAEAIIKQLDEGGNFETIANEKTTDPSGKTSGGDLGYFGPGQMVPEFEQAAFALDVGAYTKTPVQSQFGFHVIKVEDRRAQQPPAFEQVKEQYRSQLFRDKYFELVKSTRDAAKVEIPDPALKAAVEQLDRVQ